MYQTIDQIKKANKAAGNYFFSPQAMEVFNSEVESEVINNRFFVTSERMEENDAKRYTIRVAHDDGTIDTVGDFRGYDNLADAINDANAAPVWF